jgi:hypothetical protein
MTQGYNPTHQTLSPRMLNVTEEALWAFKSQSGNPAMSPYWTFREN